MGRRVCTGARAGTAITLCAALSGRQSQGVRVALSLGRDVLAGLWELQVDGLFRRTLVNAGQVGDKHVGEAVHLRAIAAGELGIDAVHVHLSVANGIEPRPGHNSMAVLDALGDVEIELVNTLGFISSTKRLCFSVDQIAFGVGRASTFYRVDNFLAARILELRGIGLIGDGHLAAATAVDSGIVAFAEVERQKLLRASRHLCASR